jgi:four helix bundle protein
MSKRIERFEDFVAWQKARALTASIYKVTSEGHFAKDFGLKDQIRRASVSIMSNIAEGFERGRSSEFHQFLSIAKASCAELRSQLYIALDAGYLSPEAFDKLMAIEVGQVVGGLRKSVEQRRDA